MKRIIIHKETGQAMQSKPFVFENCIRNRNNDFIAAIIADDNKIEGK